MFRVQYIQTVTKWFFNLIHLDFKGSPNKISKLISFEPLYDERFGSVVATTTAKDDLSGHRDSPALVCRHPSTIGVGVSSFTSALPNRFCHAARPFRTTVYPSSYLVEDGNVEIKRHFRDIRRVKIIDQRAHLQLVKARKRLNDPTSLSSLESIYPLGHGSTTRLSIEPVGHDR